MHVTTIDHYRPAPGEFLSWSVDASGSVAQPSRVPPSFNQSVHLSGADDHSTWLAASFRVSGRIDRDALARAYHALITRHGTLHSSFTKRDNGVTREEHDPRTLVLTENPGVRATSPAALQQAVWATLDAACHPFGFPAYLLAAIDRRDRSTILCGFDHAHVDAYSMSIIIDDLHTLYEGFRGATEDARPQCLPMSGNFVDYCAAEAEMTEVGPSDPRLLSWLRFFDDHGGGPPTFPLDLGLGAGERAPQGADVRPLLDAASTERLAGLCRRNGCSTYGGVLSAMAHAVRRLGGGPELALLFPMHTRRSEPWHNAVGWFTTNAPISVVGTDDLRDTLRRTGPELRRAMRLGGVPIPQVISALGGLSRVRDDIFMVSYVDYRAVPGAAIHDEIDAQHISNVTTADDAQFWISRTIRGLSIRSRYPDTDMGRATITEFLAEVRGILTEAVDARSVPPAGLSSVTSDDLGQSPVNALA
ncbi:condensation domain-containing protein [Gordonia sp. OPL2]|uniref:condensation domain-containing protein n=1 Tax=Gordonia sp. OPL2 TaxID=2486274 RepID=UPI0016558C18|nr:condensation domain-containing protein [Gordonia sp. OPL2]RPA10244.1 peptide synthase [Gordonia sp. OPL2]